MKKFLNWLVRSSSDPSAVSLTVRGALIGIIPTILLFAQQFHWAWTQEQLTEAIQAITMIVSSFLVIVGMFRKLALLATK